MRLSNDEIRARQELWSLGVIAAWYLRDSQMEIYDLIQRERFAFIEAARRFGKTTSILCFVLEKLIRNPGWICRWCFPNKNQAREVLIAEVEKLNRFAPKGMGFTYQTTDSVFIGPGGSLLYIRGVNEDKGNSARGPAANILIADEYGFWMEPDYIIRECLFPQLEGQEGRWLVKASTPPRDLGHLYYTEKEQAERDHRFIQKTIYDKETLTDEELQEIIKESGGVESPAFKRERLCLPVSDPDMLVIPEWMDEIGENVVPDDYPRPQFFTPYVGGDSGADDNTVMLFGFYDFTRNEIVVEEELVLNGRTTAEIIGQAKAIEARLWPHMAPHKRVYDAPKQLIYDLYTDHTYPVQMPMKEDKHAAIHELRVEVGARRFKAKERCKALRRQMKVGMWKDDRHSDFQRTDGLGHLDAIAAAIYLQRCVDRRLNPIPQHFGYNHYTHHIPVSGSQASTTTEESLQRLLGPRARRIR